MCELPWAAREVEASVELAVFLGACVCWEVVMPPGPPSACPVLGKVTSVDCAEPLLFGAGWPWPVGHGQGLVCVAELLCVS